jgi:uncharacterized membrane protein YhaH (DUF805 family)
MAYFIKALKNYAGFKGRAHRAEFWWYFLIYIVIMIVAQVVAGIIGFPLLYSIVALAFLCPTIAVGWRRMQDLGKQGYFILIPIYGLILAAGVGMSGPNEFGPDPKTAG